MNEKEKKNELLRRSIDKRNKKQEMAKKLFLQDGIKVEKYFENSFTRKGAPMIQALGSPISNASSS
jgi:hypothetical protein